MVSIVPLQRRQAEARMDLSGTTRGELPIPMTAAVVSGAGHAHNGQQQQQMMMAPLMPAPAAAEAESNNNAAAPGIGFGKKRPASASASAGNGGGGALAVKYRECLKNHAAAIGGNATDGCGEFMASGEDGSLEALKCSACGCHRNFHRKDVDDDLAALGRRLLLAPPHPRGVFPGSGADHHGLPPRQIVMPLSMVHHSSESDDMDGGHGLGLGGAALLPRSVGGHGGGSSSSQQQQQQKRFRTKFTAEQKARMLAFAERVGWRLQRAEDAAVQRFCAEAGVKRRVLKVWMHNNKHSLATKLTSTSPLPIQAQGQPPMAPAPVNSMPPPQEPGPSSSPPQDDQLSQLE